MAQTTSLVFNGGVIPSPSPVPSGTGKAKLLKIGEITITEQGAQVTKNVICDPDSVTAVAPFMEVLTSAKLAELVEANSILVLDDGDMQYLMANASITVEEGISVCTAVNFLGLSQENRAKVAYNCTRITDELTLQQVIEVGEPVETGFNLVTAYSEDTEPGTLIDKLEIVDNVRDPEDPEDPPLLRLERTLDGEGNRKVAVNEDTLKAVINGIKKNKIHRYSFGTGIVNGETPVYGNWLIDLDKPDPNGPEGYARVTPAEFWKSTAVNGEVPVYLQDKNSNNSLTYAYLSRADVTKSGNTVTNVFAYFVRSGHRNDLAISVGFRFTKLPGSDYLQKATATDDSFNARSVAGIAMTHQTGQYVDHTVTSGEVSSGHIRIPLSHFDQGVYLLNIQLYASLSSHFGSNRVPLRVSFRYIWGSSEASSQEYTGAFEQIDQNGPWYYGSTIQLNTKYSSLTGIDVEFYFGTNKLVENDTIGVKIDYTLLSEPS